LLVSAVGFAKFVTTGNSTKLHISHYSELLLRYYELNVDVETLSVAKTNKKFRATAMIADS